MIKLVESILNILHWIVAGAFGLSADMVNSLLSGTDTLNKEFDADFIKVTKLLSPNKAGVSLDGVNNLTIKDSFACGNVVGKAGVGKGSVVLYPSLANHMKHNINAVCYDPSSETTGKIRAVAEHYGYEIKRMNPADPDYSEGFNPLKRVIHSPTEIAMLAQALVQNVLGTNSRDPFWETQSATLLQNCMNMLRYQEPEYQHLTNVRHLINSYLLKGAAIDSLVVQTNNKEIFREHANFLSYDSKVRKNIISTSRSVMALWGNENVQQATSWDSIDFNELRDSNKKLLLMINNEINKAEFYRPLISVFMQQLADALMPIPRTTDKAVMVHIDEAANIYLPGQLVQIMANSRKARFGVTNYWQSYSQCQNLYGSFEAESIFSVGHFNVWMPGQNLESCTKLEALLGKREYIDEDSNQRRVRPLMTASEIRQTDRSLILCGSETPIHAELHPYYLQKRYKKFLQTEDAEIEKPVSKIPFGTVPLLDLDKF